MKGFLSFAFVVLSGSALFGQDSTASSSPQRIAPWFVERFRISAGFFMSLNNTNLSASIKGGAPGTEIDAETDLGFNPQTNTAIVSAQWRTKRRSRLSLTNYRIRRGSTHTLDKDIIFNGVTYPASASIKSSFNTNIVQFSYGYAIFERPKWEAGLSFGMHVVGADATLAVSGSGGSTSNTKNIGLTAPLPDFGVWGGYAISKRWAISAEFDYLSLTVNGITGSILAYNALVTFKATDRLDLAAGFTGLDFKVHADRTHYDAYFNWGYKGPSLTAAYSFGRKYWGH